MTSKNTTNFKFLEEIRPELYELAVRMEEDLLVTPVSMLAYATRFLEYILHDVADENNYDVNTKAGFVDKVNQLIRFDYLSNSRHNNLPQLLIDAYNDRSYSIHSHKIRKSLKEDENLAFKLNETLFYIADAYYKKLTGNDEEHIYIKPGKAERDFKSKTDEKSKKYPINILNKDEKDFKKDILPKSKPVNEYKGESVNAINEDEYAFKNDISHKSEPVEESSTAEKDESKHIQHQNSRNYDESEIGEFLELLKNGYSEKNALKHVDVNQTIVNDWYMDKKSEFLNGYKDELFVKYNELLIENTIKSISENDSAGGNRGKLEFWIENFDEYISHLAQDLTGEQLKVFQLIFKRNTPKRINKNLVDDKPVKKIPIKANIDEKELERRMQLMLDYIEKYNYNMALKKSRLQPIEIQKSKKEFIDGKRNNFYYRLSEKLRDMYLTSRRNGKSTYEFCRQMRLDKFEVEFWLENELFKDFQTRYNKIRVLLFKQAMDNNKSHEIMLNDLEMKRDEFNDFIQLINTDPEYIGVRQSIKPYLSSKYSQYSHEAFLKEFRKNPNVDEALKKLNFSKNDLEETLNSNKKLYDEFMEMKVDEIVKNKFNNEKVNLNQLDMTQDEYSQIEDQIDEKVTDEKIRKMTKGLSDGMMLITASNLGFDVDEVFDWILKGSAGNNRFTKFVDEYWRTYIEYVNILNSNGRIDLKDSQNTLAVFGFNDHINYWKKWGLINKENSILSVNDIKKILKEYLEDNYEH